MLEGIYNYQLKGRNRAMMPAQTKLKQFEEWAVVEQQVSKTKIARIGWKRLFGRTLTKEVAELYALGYGSQEAYIILREKLKGSGGLDDLQSRGWQASKVFKNLKIGVCARFGEIRSEANEIRRVEKHMR